MNYKIVYTEYDISNEHFEILNKQEKLGIDTEALGLNIKRDRLCLIQICDYENKTVHIIHFKKNNYKQSKNLVKLFKNKKIQKIFHFARFDLAIIFYYLKALCLNVYCTKIASKICRTYTERHGLKELCSKLLSIEINKGNGSSYWGGELNQGQKKYASDDVIYLSDLKDKLDEMLKNENRLELAKICLSGLTMSVYCDLEGFDPVYILNHH